VNKKEMTSLLPKWLTKTLDYGDGYKQRVSLFDHDSVGYFDPMDHFEERVVNDDDRVLYNYNINKDKKYKGKKKTIYISQPCGSLGLNRTIVGLKALYFYSHTNILRCLIK
jgi:hypothetical protein